MNIDEELRKEANRKFWQHVRWGLVIIILAAAIVFVMLTAGCCWPQSLGGSTECDPKPEISFWSNVAGMLGNIFVPGTGEFWSATATAGLGALYGTAKVAHKKGHKKGFAAASKMKAPIIENYPSQTTTVSTSNPPQQP